VPRENTSCSQSLPVFRLFFPLLQNQQFTASKNSMVKNPHQNSYINSRKKYRSCNKAAAAFFP
jgi:hypothetical protein